MKSLKRSRRFDICLQRHFLINRSRCRKNRDVFEIITSCTTDSLSFAVTTQTQRKNNKVTQKHRLSGFLDACLQDAQCVTVSSHSSCLSPTAVYLQLYCTPELGGRGENCTAANFVPYGRAPKLQ